MALSIVMPALEMAQETGKLLSWLKKEGEQVKKGEPLLEVETDKAVVEVEAPGDGILAGVRVAIGAVVPVGETMAWLVQPGETPPAEIAASQSGRRSEATSANAAPRQVQKQETAVSTESRISPKARRLAKEQGVDINRLRGSGPDGEILAADIIAAAGTAGAALSGTGSMALPSTVGRLMAERTTQSWTSVPHFFVVRDVFAGALLELHRKLGPEIGRKDAIKPTLTDLMIFLTGRTLLKHPRLNASWTSEGIRLHSQVNIGVAIAVDDGVAVGVIPNAGAVGLAEIAHARRGLTERARSGKLQPADIAGATFTISNLGMYGVDAFTAIIVPPQAAILAVAQIADRVVAVDGQPVVRPMVTLSLSSDHRGVDGARAAEFMQDLAGAIESPQQYGKQ